MSACEPVNAVLQEWSCILQRRGTVMYRWRSLLCLTTRTDGVCMCLHFTFYLPGSRSLGAQPADHFNQNPLDQAHIHTPTHIKQAAWKTSFSFLFFGVLLKFQANTNVRKHTGQSSNLRKNTNAVKLNTNSSFSSKPHLDTGMTWCHTAILSWSCRAETALQPCPEY